MSSAERQIAPAASETFKDFAITDVRYKQISLLNGNSGESTFVIHNHAGHVDFSTDGDKLTVNLIGESEHKQVAQALRWIADRLDGAA